MNESPFGVHQVKLVVQPGPGLCDGGGVGEHTDSPGGGGITAPQPLLLQDLPGNLG